MLVPRYGDIREEVREYFDPKKAMIKVAKF